MKPMRRKDREVSDFTKVVETFMNCEVVHLGLFDDEEPEYPYIVPVNFMGYVEEGTMYMYIHGSKQGRKAELMAKNKVCSFVMDGERKVDVLPEHQDITTRYECIMGKAEIELLEGDEAIEALSYVADNYAGYDFEWNHKTAEVTLTARLKVTDWSCKINPMNGQPD